MKKIKNLLKLSDFSSFQPQLYSNQDYRYKTVLGGFFQLIIFVIYLGSFLAFGKDIYLKENPNVIQAEEYRTINPPLLSIDNRDFVFAIGLKDRITLNPIIDQKVINVEFYQVELSRDNVVTRRRLESGPCSPAHFEAYNSFYHGQFNFTNYFCLGLSEKYFLQGTNSFNRIIKFVQIEFSKCSDQIIENGRCETNSQIEKELNNYLLDFMFIDKAFNSKNYENQISYFLNNFQFFGNSSSYKEIKLNLNLYELIDDTGIIFEEFQTNQTTKIENFFENVDFSQKSQIFLNFSFFLSEKVKIIQRGYIKAQFALASASGVVGFFMAVFGKICFFVTSNLYLTNLSSKYFECENVLKLKKTKKKANLTYNEFYSENDETKRINENFQEKNKKMKFFENFFKLNTDNTNIKELNGENANRSLHKTNKLIKTLMDYEYFLKKFNEINVIKKILFNEDQLKLINYISSSKIGFTYFFFEEKLKDSKKLIVIEEIAKKLNQNYFVNRNIIKLLDSLFK